MARLLLHAKQDSRSILRNAMFLNISEACPAPKRKKRKRVFEVFILAQILNVYRSINRLWRWLAVVLLFR